MSKYMDWETFKNGMYKTISEIKDFDLQVLKAYHILTNKDLFYEMALKMVNEWPVACEEFLRNRNGNKLAFIGQATCCFIEGVPELATKEAWAKSLNLIKTKPTR